MGLQSVVILLATLATFVHSQATGSVSLGGLDLLGTIAMQQRKIEQLEESLRTVTARLYEFMARYETEKMNNSLGPTEVDSTSDLKCDLYNLIYGEDPCANRSQPSGVYELLEFNVFGSVKITNSIYCDMTTDSGGWTVIQRRTTAGEDFAVNWKSYQLGFGNISVEQWTGINKIHIMTSAEPHELRIDFYESGFGASSTGRSRYAKYSSIRVAPSCSNYKLSLGEYSGNAGDILRDSDGAEFSTYDSDHDGNSARNCASDLGGGWWHSSTCSTQGFLNSPVIGRTNWGVQFDQTGVFQFETVEMKIRPITNNY